MYRVPRLLLFPGFLVVALRRCGLLGLSPGLGRLGFVRVAIALFVLLIFLLHGGLLLIDGPQVVGFVFGELNGGVLVLGGVGPRGVVRLRRVALLQLLALLVVLDLDLSLDGGLEDRLQFFREPDLLR
jgi:hypothetical protein